MVINNRAPGLLINHDALSTRRPDIVMATEDLFATILLRAVNTLIVNKPAARVLGPAHHHLIHVPSAKPRTVLLLAAPPRREEHVVPLLPAEDIARLRRPRAEQPAVGAVVRELRDLLVRALRDPRRRVGKRYLEDALLVRPERQQMLPLPGPAVLRLHGEQGRVEDVVALRPVDLEAPVLRPGADLERPRRRGQHARVVEPLPDVRVRLPDAAVVELVVVDVQEVRVAHLVDRGRAPVFAQLGDAFVRPGAVEGGGRPDAAVLRGRVEEELAVGAPD